MKAAGIKMIFIDPFYNDTMAVYGGQWIPVNGGTDEAFAAAIAYVWITQNQYNTDFVAKYTQGFDKFKDYVLGTSDGTPKTPDWAAGICGVDAATITALALEWASKPTAFAIGTDGMMGANRKFNAGSLDRVLLVLATMQGIGLPGRGLLDYVYPTSGVGMPTRAAVAFIGGTIPAIQEPFEAPIRHGQFKDAILNPPITWTSTILTNYPTKIVQMQYPLPGNSEVHLIAGMGGSAFSLNQAPNTNDHVRLYRVQR